MYSVFTNTTIYSRQNVKVNTKGTLKCFSGGKTFPNILPMQIRKSKIVAAILCLSTEDLIIEKWIYRSTPT